MNIVLYGAPVLKEKSTVVEEINDELRTILDEMVELMRKAKGVGLAANQVGIAKRFFVLEIEDKVKKVINPEIVEFGEEIVEYEEGCLSIPEIYKKVNRPEMIRVKYQNENGEIVEEELHDLWARAFQHEFDHIDGILFTERLSIMNKRLVAKKLTVLKRDYEKGKIYDPSSGKTYDCYMELNSDGTLKVRGHIPGMKFLGKTQTWRRYK